MTNTTHDEPQAVRGGITPHTPPREAYRQMVTGVLLSVVAIAIAFGLLLLL